MPTYVYRCAECETVWEAFQRITADPLTDCPNGHLGTAKRVIQPVGIAFNGSGFYVNDSAGSAGVPAASVSSVPESKGAEAKPEAEATTSTAPADKSE